MLGLSLMNQIKLRMSKHAIYLKLCRLKVYKFFNHKGDSDHAMDIVTVFVLISAHAPISAHPGHF